MAQATLLEKAGLVVALCPNTGVYERLATTARNRRLGCTSLRAAGSGSTLQTIRDHAAATPDCEFAKWLDRLQPIDRLSEDAVLQAFEHEPILSSCFRCLAKLPVGGAPWQGSWRGNALRDMLKAISQGGILLVVEAHSLEEQRDCARTLLKSGCAFVQTHDGARPC